MSYILEALKKSDAERKRGEVPTLDTVTSSGGNVATHGKSPLPWILSGVMGVTVLGLGGFLIWDRLQPPPQTTKTVAERIAETAQKQSKPTDSSRDPFAVVETTPELAPTPQTRPTPSGAPKPMIRTEMGSNEKPVTLWTPTPKTPSVTPPPAAARTETADTAPNTPAAQPAEETPIDAVEPDTTTPPSLAQAQPKPVEPTQPTPPKFVRVGEAAEDASGEASGEAATQAQQPSPPAENGEIAANAPEETQDSVATVEPPQIEEPKVKELAIAEDAPAVEPPPPAPQPQPKPQAQPKPRPTAPSAEQISRRKSAESYVNKAWSAIDKGFYNQAMRDLDSAVELESNYADAWFARGWTNEKSGKELSAIGDYARAIKAQPDHAFALFSRGYLNLYIASPARAVTDFIRTRGVAQDHSLQLYAHLWLYLSRTRAGQDARTKLAEDTTDEKLDLWPAPLLHHYLGQIDEPQVLASMRNADKLQKPERQATGHFFLGIKALEDGKTDKARTHFEKVLATGAVQFRQYDAAKRELERLNR